MSKQTTELSGGVVREAKRPASVLSHAERLGAGADVVRKKFADAVNLSELCLYLGDILGQGIGDGKSAGGNERREQCHRQDCLRALSLGAKPIWDKPNHPEFVV